MISGTLVIYIILQINNVINANNLSLIETLFHYGLLSEQDRKMPIVNISSVNENVIKIVQFGIVGGLMILLNVIILYLLTSVLGIYYIFSAIVSYMVLTGLSFFLNENWTFNSVTHHTHKKMWHRVVSYYLVALSGMTLYILILFLLTEYVNVFYLYSSIIASFSVYLWNFSLNKNITWGEKQGL